MVDAFLIGSRGTITAGLRKYAKSNTGKSGGKARAEKQKEIVAAKHAEVRRLQREIEKRRIKSKEVALSELALARSIARELPEGMKLGVRQVSNILKAAKI